MKKFTLFAAGAALALSANAQYTTATPYADQSVVAGQVQIFDIVLGAQSVFDGLEAAGQKTNNLLPNGETNNLWVWEETFVGGDGSYPGVGYNDFQFDGYTSLNVANVGWSGAGFDIQSDFDNTHWTDETKFHVAFRTAGTAPASVAFILANSDGSTPGNFAIGAPFDDNGTIYAPICDAITDEWQAVDISFADIKKLQPSFNYIKSKEWHGNIVAFLAGGTEGRNISLDCAYFHTPSDDSAVGTVADDVKFVVTANTVNVANAQNIKIYDLSGKLIKSVEGTTAGISELASGIYVAKAGNAVKKIMK